MESRKIVLVLLGASGEQKISLEKNITESREDVMFFPTEEELCHRSVPQHRESDDNRVKRHKMIREKFEEFRISTVLQILVLYCVNDLEDAECVTSEAQTHDLQVYRALLLSADEADTDSWPTVWRNHVPTVSRLGLLNTDEDSLRHWYQNFNAVLNYYKRMNVLSLSDMSSIYEFVFGHDYLLEAGNVFFRVIAPPNYNRYLLLDSVKCRLLYDKLLSILRVSDFQFLLPVSFVNCARDVTWVGNPRRYHVTSQADGVRCLLLKVDNNSFLINSNQEIFPCDINHREIPNNTVFDGVLLPSTSFADIDPSIESTLETSVYLVHDILAVSELVKWTLPFSKRVEALNDFNINRDIIAVINEANTSNSNNFISDTLNVHPKQPINASKLKVLVAVKENHPSTPAEIESCLASSSRLPYHSNGLTFIPEMLYNFGEDSLSFQWQPEHHISCYIGKKALMSGKHVCDLPDLSQAEDVIECKWNNMSNAWKPIAQRYDMVAPDSDEMVDHVQKISQKPYPKWRLQSELQRQSETFPSVERSYSSIGHPALAYDFNELYSLIHHEFHNGHVTKCSDSSTKLEVFHRCHTSSAENPITQLCQDFVLHPRTKTVVTMSFANVFPDPNKIKSNDLVEATMKFDGLLCIAFQWSNEIMVSCKGAMNSSHATWSKDWITKNCHVKKFIKGYTYVIEIVRKESMTIVKHPFEGLVLLSVTNAEGYELSYDIMMNHGVDLGFIMVTPRIFGRLGDVLWYCGGRLPIPEKPAQSSLQDSLSNYVRPKPPDVCYFKEAVSVSLASAFSGALPTSSRSHKGWVLRFGNGTRKEVIYHWWNSAFMAAKLVHPQVAWLLKKYDNINDIFGNLPNIFQKEFNLMMYALQRRFSEVLVDISKPLDILKKFSEDCGSFCSDLSNRGEEEDIPSNPARRRRLSDSLSPEHRFQDSEQDNDDLVIDRLRIQLFESLKVMSRVSPRETFERCLHDSPSDTTSQLRDDSTNDGSSDVASTFLRALNNTLRICSTADKKHLLKNARNLLSCLSQDDQFLIDFVKKALQRNPSDNFLSCFSEELCKKASVSIATCEEIFEIILTPEEARFSFSTSASLPCMSQSTNQHSAEQKTEDLLEIFSRSSQDLLDNTRDFYEILLYHSCRELRIPTLDYIRTDAPEINGYEPSSYFKETWSKHWEALPVKEKELEVLHTILISIYGPAAIWNFPDEVLLLILKLLDGSSLVMLSRVCRKFHGIVNSEELFLRKVSAAKAEHARKVEEDNVLTLGWSEESYEPDSYS